VDDTPLQITVHETICQICSYQEKLGLGSGEASNKYT